MDHEAPFLKLIVDEVPTVQYTRTEPRWDRCIMWDAVVMVIVDGVSGKSTFFVTKYHPFIPKFTMSEKLRYSCRRKLTNIIWRH